MPTRFLRTVSQSPYQLTDRDRQHHEADDSADDQLADGSTMITARCSVDTPGGADQQEGR
jgi:hypothetical protein